MTETRSRSGEQDAHGCDREWLISLFTDLIQPLGMALPASSEVVLHDLSELPNSIVAVQGDVTGRQIGGPATDLLLERATCGDLDHMIGYTTTLADGRQLRSTTMIIRDASGEPAAALCINTDLSTWRSLQRMATAMMGDTPAMPSPAMPGHEPSEVFARDVDELAAHLVHMAIAEQGVPVDLMKKEHKLAVVRVLRERGMFMLRDAVEMIAGSLQVTRFTIYNYLNEIEDEQSSSSTTRQRKTKRKD